jgi:hypothetical protein
VAAGGGRATAIVDVLVPCVLALSLVTACSTGATAEPSGGPRQASGISREEYCAMGGHVVTRITAEQERTAVVVRWSEFTSSLDERVFRVYRRSGPAAPWSRVAEVELPPGHGGSWRDPAPPPPNATSPDTTQYAVTQVSSTCGEGRLCAGAPPAQQCSLATVPRREQ